MLIPDRLPSLVLLVSFWMPPAALGWAAADYVQRLAARTRASLVYAGLGALVLVWAAAWFFINLNAMPPYMPGATQDPRFAPPEAVAALKVFTSVVIAPGSAIACWLAFRSRRRG